MKYIWIICPNCQDPDTELRGPIIGDHFLEFSCRKCGCEWRLIEKAIKKDYDNSDLFMFKKWTLYDDQEKMTSKFFNSQLTAAQAQEIESLKARQDELVREIEGYQVQEANQVAEIKKWTGLVREMAKLMSGRAVVWPYQVLHKVRQLLVRAEVQELMKEET